MEKATLYRAEKLDNLLVFNAHYQRFRFNRHSHDDFALGLMYRGVQRFFCRGAERNAPAGSLISVNPDEIHDGMSADKRDFCYRILYIPHSVLQSIGKEMVAPRTSHYFSQPVIQDKRLAVQLCYLFQILDKETSDRLEAQTVLYSLLGQLLARHGTEREQVASPSQLPSTIFKACSYIIENARKDVSLDDIAAEAGLSRYHFLRLFTKTMSISPYAFLLHRRLQIARDVIGSGVSLGDAAHCAGFADQSHMTRRFKSAFGITPGQYQKAVC